DVADVLDADRTQRTEDPVDHGPVTGLEEGQRLAPRRVDAATAGAATEDHAAGHERIAGRLRSVSAATSPAQPRNGANSDRRSRSRTPRCWARAIPSDR